MQLPRFHYTPPVNAVLHSASKGAISPPVGYQYATGNTRATSFLLSGFYPGLRMIFRGIAAAAERTGASLRHTTMKTDEAPDVAWTLN